MTDLKTTPLHALHQEAGAKMVSFAGYHMPVQYPLGVMGEHLHTRSKAGLFDVSHMGQIRVDGPGAALALETMIPVDVVGLAVGRQRYGFLTNATGGLLDDLMLANRGDHFLLVVNAACKDADLARLRAQLPPDVTATPIPDRALMALQGPLAEDALSGLNTGVRDMAFMDVVTLDLDGIEAWVSRSGYTGEDGFEISVPEDDAERLARRLLGQPEVEPIGLGARDSLRLEAGLCLYGHDIGPDTSPVEAGLLWAIQKVRRAGGERAGGFPGADRILDEIAQGATRKRVGLRPEGRAPMREGVQIFADADSEAPVGTITSGGFGPTVGGPVALAYVSADLATSGTTVFGELRGRRLPLTVTPLPFTPANFKR